MPGPYEITNGKFAQDKLGGYPTYHDRRIPFSLGEKLSPYSLSGTDVSLLDKRGFNGNIYTTETRTPYLVNPNGVISGPAVIPNPKDSLSPIDIFNQNRDSVLAQKKAENKQINKQIRRENRKEKWNNFNEKWNNGLGEKVGAGAAIAGQVGDDLLNKSYKGNQGAFVSGAFSLGNPMYDSANNINTTIASTDYNDLNSQYQNKLKQINQYKTDKLSSGQIAGMAGVGAAKGASMGASAGPIGAIVGGVVGGAAGLGKGLSTNNKISDANLAIQQKGLEANNYMNRAMMDIKSQQMKRAKQDIFNNSFYHTRANGGYLYSNGGLMNPYGINEFNTGGTHEKNKYGGVPVSIAEDGKPNLVEEGEVLFDDYVYSNRININNTIRRRLKLKDSTKTFADAAKEVKERGDDRPNDSVTEKTIKAQMQFLKSEQDKKKEQQEEREQQKMIAQMNEQQLQAMQEQQMNEEADAYEQQMAEEQMAQQAPQEQQMDNPQMQEQMMAQQQQPQQQMFANGGNLKGGSNDADAHRFAGEDIKTDKTRKKENDTLNEDISDYVVGLIQAIQDNDELNNEQKQEAYDNLFNSINEYQINHSGLRNQPLTPKSDAVKKLQDTFKKFGVDINDAIIGKNFDVGEGGITGDSAKKGWVSDGYMGNETLARTLGYQLNDKQISKVQQALKNAGIKNWDFKNNFSDKAKDYSGFVKTEPPTEKTYKGGEDVLPNYDWKYKQTPIPGLIDSYLAARAFAPADYSRANSIINTPIRDIQYTPNGGKIAPYIIDPRLQYQMNADLGAATNRGLVNNAGGNSAAAQAALLANNRQISQSAANLGYQADAQNAAQIQAAQQFNNAVDAQNAQGFLSAAEANQRADVQRGEFNYYGQNMKENIDAQRGQAISNSLQSLSDDYMNYYKDRYNQGMMAGLVDSGYFGEPTPFLRQQAGWNPNGTFTRNNYLIDDNGNKHYIVNNADGTVAFANPNDDLISKNQGKKLMFNNTNGQYYFG